MVGHSVSDAFVIDRVQRVLAQSQKNIHADLKRGLGFLATIATTAPLVGLFGTTIGIMRAFRGCGAQKSYCLAATANGISEALISTAFGLLVAVPALWFYNYFTSALEALDVETANSSLELESYLALRVTNTARRPFSR
jgi:biopolymer transport protein ExbB/TolQ